VKNRHFANNDGSVGRERIYEALAANTVTYAFFVIVEALWRQLHHAQ